VAVGANLEVNFSENIAVGSGNIVITNLTDHTASTIDVTLGLPQVTVSGNTLTINPTLDLQYAKQYAILIDAGVVTDTPVGNPFAGITSTEVWNFETRADPAILKHGLNNTDTPDYVDPALTYTTLTAPLAYTTTAVTEGTHQAQWTGAQIVGQILFSFSLAPQLGGSLDLDATDTVTWDIGAESAHSTGIILYSTLFIASDAAFTTILAQSSTFSVSASSGTTTDTTPYLNFDDGSGSDQTLYFGFAFSDNSGVDNKYGRLDNIVVNGVAIAAPASGTVFRFR